MSNRLGIDLSQFMDQWIFGPGHPTYRVRWNSLENRLAFNIEQRQDEQDVFVSPVRFFITYDDETMDTIIVQNTERIQFFSMTLPKNVLTIHQDNDWSILSTRSIARDLDIVLSVDGKIAPEIAMWNTRTSFKITSSEPIDGKLTILDLLGRSVLSENLHAATLHHAGIGRLAPGAYFAMLDTPQGRKTHRFEIH